MFGTGVRLDHEVFSPTIHRTDPGLDAATWAAAHRSAIDALRTEHGAVLLRGFEVCDPASFQRLSAALVDELYGEYGDLPHEKDSDQVYKSTPYPEDQSILFHHESSHLPQWPTRQFFCCLQPSPRGGTTPIVDGREVYRQLPEELVARFTEHGIRYTRNFIRGLDVGWPEMFGTDDRDEVERRCAAQGVACEWLPDGTLRTRQWAPAVLQHPTTGEWVFFNQLFLHHTACLEPSMRETMRALFGDDESTYPRSAAFGDGSPIDDGTVAELLALYERLALRFPWQRGDVLAIDNMLVSHGRDPFEGDRKITVTMGDMMVRDALPGGAPRA
ncbi:TauD/TfdA family dioxygenase [Streptomyces sp. DSM 44915]|uniref:TauD/TfdA family dioxygenase n=1 Tax=Streptomyces chisholmiae TaxID=3075540 RepID=A0ABU2JW00_9ACTN|nr:TauD/TfdA family dioxygenase [Streptomyces sp. DSM 44915]MDT0269144.1 TauD/TfdA family dioxygenase [Streptomyces sp. DSM 44915]